jgi:hypothetical protein
MPRKKDDRKTTMQGKKAMVCIQIMPSFSLLGFILNHLLALLLARRT